MLRVRNWNKHYEKSRTREVKSMQWLALNVNLSSDGYATLMQGDDSYSMYGAWCAILQVAAQCEPRGELIRSNGKDHDAESIAMLSRGDAKTVARALDRLVAIGWVERSGVSVGSQTGSINPVLKHEDLVLKHLTDKTDKTDTTVQESTAPKSPAETAPEKVKRKSYPEAFERWYAVYPKVGGKSKALAKWKKAIKEIDADELYDITAAFAKSPMGNTSDTKYLKDASAWLNQRRWEDGDEAWGVVYSDTPEAAPNPNEYSGWAKTHEEKLARFGLNPDQVAWIEKHGDDFDYPGVKGADHLLPENR